jgi:hypothetical protein
VVEALMSARTPIILLIVAATLLAYVLLFERDRPGRAEIDLRSGLLLESVVRERITGIRIASGDERLVLAREGEGFDETWTLEEPKQAPADLQVVDDYLRNWEYAVPIRTLHSPSAEDLHSFGLDTPKAEVTFEMGRAKVRVSLGSGSPVHGGGYLRIDDARQVAVVSDDVVALFDSTAGEFEIKDDAGAPDLQQLVDAEKDASVAVP